MTDFVRLDSGVYVASPQPPETPSKDLTPEGATKCRRGCGRWAVLPILGWLKPAEGRDDQWACGCRGRSYTCPDCVAKDPSYESCPTCGSGETLT